MKKNRTVILIALAVNALWGALIFYLSARMAHINDDILYTKSLLTGEEITSVSQLIPSAVFFWENWSGRFLPLLVIQALLMLPKTVFNLLNALVYVITINTIASFGDCFYTDKNNRSVHRLVNLCFLYLLSWFCMPAMSSVLFWMTGSVAYLWTGCVVLLFIRLFMPSFAALLGWEINTVHKDAGTGKGAGARRIAAFLLLGFGAGFSNEVPSCTIMALFFAYVCLSFIKKRKIPLHEWLGMIAMAAGSCLLMLAPGNFARSSYVDATAGGGSLLTELTWRIGRETYYGLRYLLIPFAISVLLYLLAARNGGEGEKKKGLRLTPEICFWILSFVAVYVMTFANGYATRVLQFPFFLLLIANAIGGAKVLDGVRETLLKKLWLPFALAGLFVCVELVTGVIQSGQSGLYFDRTMVYHYTKESASLIEGNGAVR